MKTLYMKKISVRIIRAGKRMDRFMPQKLTAQIILGCYSEIIRNNFYYFMKISG